MKQKIDDALRGVSRLYLDSSPVIYFVERDPAFYKLAHAVMQRVSAGALTAVTGSVTLAECLVGPIRNSDRGLAIRFIKTITRSHNTEFWSAQLDAIRAARISANRRLRLPDAIQVATALDARCDAILTNDVDFKRVAKDIPILVLSELEI